jgi:hypothetical protein
MPRITAQIGGTGATFDLIVGITPSRQQALVKAHRPLPPPLRIRAVLDTGAFCTVIDSKILQSLELEPKGKIQVHTPSTTGQQPYEANQYDVLLAMFHPSGPPLVERSMAVIESDLSGWSGQALIGRDLLSKCVVVYDGPSDNCILCF